VQITEIGTMKSAARARLAAAVVALAFVAMPHAMFAASALSQLRGVDELKSWFNAHKGHPRLVFLLSPT
jgi:hypothetical protein